MWSHDCQTLKTVAKLHFGLTVNILQLCLLYVYIAIGGHRLIYDLTIYNLPVGHESQWQLSFGVRIGKRNRAARLFLHDRISATSERVDM